MVKRPASFSLLAVLALSAPALAAPALAASDWTPAAKSRARLVADAQGAGFQIELAPGAITYWRDPGEAGVPPTFDFAGSTNLASAEIDFPAPERIPEPDGSVAFGYRGAVVLPIRVKAADPSQPVRLAAKVDYAVCEKICVPARASGEIVWPGGTDAGLGEARAQVPRPVAAEALGVVATPTGPKGWRLCFAAAPRDLFLRRPRASGSNPSARRTGRCFALTLQQAPEGRQAPFRRAANGRGRKRRIGDEGGAGGMRGGLLHFFVKNIPQGVRGTRSPPTSPPHVRRRNCDAESATKRPVARRRRKT